VAASILLRHSADPGAKDAGGNIPFTMWLWGAAAWLLNGGVQT
jgi:hypothetical protein